MVEGPQREELVSLPGTLGGLVAEGFKGCIGVF